MSTTHSTDTPIMAIKLQAAGVVAKFPTRTEVVWRMVKEAMPNGVTANEIMRRARTIPAGTVSSVLAKMEQRAMIYSRGTKGAGPTGTQKQYLTDMERYELLPPPRDSRANASGGKKKKTDKSQSPGNVQTSSPPSPVANQQVVTPPAVAPAQLIDQLIEHLTIAEARALHRKLERMFSAKN